MQMNDAIQIRELIEEDHNCVMEIANALPQWFSQTGLDHIAVDLKFQPGFVGLRDDRIVGFTTFFVSEAVGHLGWIGVLPEFHRQGIGRSLVEQVASRLKPSGVHRLEVNTLGDSVEYEPYKRTRQFYRSLGFEEHERIPQNNPECPELLVMRKKL